jgi:hypothetical protein
MSGVETLAALRLKSGSAASHLTNDIAFAKHEQCRFWAK